MQMKGNVEELKGETVVEVKGKEGSEELAFVLADGRTFVMFHDQQCCESVIVEDIAGDMGDLIDRPLVQAEEVSGGTQEGRNPHRNVDSYTWTFYKLSTERGGVTIRWLGCSNGCYSEQVDCKWT